MWQGSATLGQQALLFFNTDVWHDQHVEVSDLRAFVQSGQPLVDVSPDVSVSRCPETSTPKREPASAINRTDRPVPG
jgi:hypothetical protein